MKKRDTTHTKAKASVRHLGCRLNQYEALAMEGRLKEAGFEMVPFGDQADLGIINTCTVTNEADANPETPFEDLFEAIHWRPLL